jgi:hypothetical protein
VGRHRQIRRLAPALGRRKVALRGLSTAVSGPATGIIKGSWPQVSVDRSGGAPRVILTDEVTGVTVGSLAGVLNLATLVRCLAEAVACPA